MGKFKYNNNECKKLNKGKSWRTVGEQFICCTGKIATVLCPHSWNEVDVLLKGDVADYVATVRGYSLQIGGVLNPFDYTCAGVGYLGIGKYASKVDGKSTVEYTRWRNMIIRCSAEYHVLFPAYLGTTVSEEFSCFQNFAQWLHDEMSRMGITDLSMLEVDKDLKGRGSKCYSRETCTLIPHALNTELAFFRPDDNKELPTGVIKRKGEKGYHGRCNTPKGIVGKYFSVSKLGELGAITAACEFYIEVKGNKLKAWADKLRYILDDKAYDLLSNPREYIIRSDQRFEMYIK